MSRGTERVGVRDSATMFVASFAAPCCCSRTKSDWTFWRRCPGSQLSPQHGVTSPRSPCKLQGCWLLDTKQAPEPCEHVGAVRDVDARCLQDSGVSRSEEHTSELQSLIRTSSAVFCLKKKKKHK